MDWRQDNIKFGQKIYGYIISGIRQDLAMMMSIKSNTLVRLKNVKQIAKDYPNDVWIFIAFTDDLLITQRDSEAEGYFNQLNHRLPNDPSRLYPMRHISIKQDEKLKFIWR